jgi:hypothetical protein
MFYSWVFGHKLNSKLRLYSAIVFVLVTLTLEFIVFWDQIWANKVPFVMMVWTLGQALIYLAEVYFFFEGGAVTMLYLLHHVPKKDEKTVLKKPKRITKKKAKK